MSTARTYNQIKNGLFGLLVIVLAGCSYDFPPEPEDTLGDLTDVDLSNSVVIGGTAFSGVHNGALTSEFSDFSFPQIFLNHIQGNNRAEWASFSPAVEADNGFNIYENQAFNETTGQYRIFYPTGDTTDFRIETTQGQTFAYANAGGEISNYSFPEAILADFTEAGRGLNPYLSAFNLAGGASPVSQISSTSPTFFVMNAGYNDLLGYAVQGGEGDVDVASAANLEYGDLMSEALFAQKLDEAVDEFLNNNANSKGALVNIPYFLNFPYFIGVRFDITPYVNGTPQINNIRTQAAIYNGRLQSYYQRNPSIPFEDRRPILDFAADRAFNWGIVVRDESLNEAYDTQGNLLPPVRHLTRDERVFLPIENDLFGERGSTADNALTEAEYLSEAEIATIEAKIQAYNQIIADKVANSNGRLVLVDFHDYYETLYDGLDLFLNREPEGITIDGVTFFPGISNFGIFSGDGLNLNPRGSALMVNVLIDALKQGFGGSLENVDPNAYAGTPIFPNEQ